MGTGYTYSEWRLLKKEIQTSELGLGGGGDKEQNFLQIEGEWGGVGMK